MPDYNKLISFFDECRSHYKELLAFENEKLSYIHEDDITQLGNSLGKEQALIMKGNSLETKRKALLKEEGLENAHIEEIKKGADEKTAKALDDRFSELSKYVLQCRHINEESLDIVKRRLKVIEEKTNSPQTYDTKGEKKQSSSEPYSLKQDI